MGYLSLDEMKDSKKAELAKIMEQKHKVASALNELTVLQLQLESAIRTIEEIQLEQSKERNNAQTAQ